MLEGKTIVVSGVGPGLGREIALVAARDGANVVLGARTAENLRAVADEIDPDGKNVAYVRTDITQPDDVQALVSLAVDRFGGIDGLACVAAQDRVISPMMDTTDDMWRSVLEVNVIGTMSVVLVATPALKQSHGAIVLIGSQAQFVPVPEVPQGAYGASKGALQSATYFLASELGKDGIRVNNLCPSWMWGPPVEMFVAWQSSLRGVAPEVVEQELIDKMALPYVASDADVAEACGFLLSDRARGITGQAILVNAGHHLR